MKAEHLVGYVIAYSESTGEPVTPTRLQALLFIIQKEVLWSNGLPSFDDYNNSPVYKSPFFPSIWEQYSMYIGIPIINVITDIHIDVYLISDINKTINKCKRIPTWKLIDNIVEYYKGVNE